MRHLSQGYVASACHTDIGLGKEFPAPFPEPRRSEENEAGQNVISQGYARRAAVRGHRPSSSAPFALLGTPFAHCDVTFSETGGMQSVFTRLMVCPTLVS